MFLTKLSTSFKSEDPFTVICKLLSKSLLKPEIIGIWKETLSESSLSPLSFLKYYLLSLLSNNGHPLLRISQFNVETLVYLMPQTVLKSYLKSFMKKTIKIMKNGLYSGLIHTKTNFLIQMKKAVLEESSSSLTQSSLKFAPIHSFSSIFLL